MSEFGWVWEPTPKHVCSPPRDLRDHFEHALWRCQGCEQYWEVYFDADDTGRKAMRMISPDLAQQRMDKQPIVINSRA